MTSEALRSAMRNFATGVCVATTYSEDGVGRRHDAVTINSLTSVSLEPPLVAMCLRRDSGFLHDLLATKSWAVSILHGASDRIARAFAADRQTRAGALDDLPAAPGSQTGALVLETASWLECVLWDHFELGDHTMVVGEVVAAGVHDREAPLIFLYGRFHALQEQMS
jgi:flavin reductase (DIM6/NTAB) family NADH-FMN oxidoreductase RutF